MWGSFYFVRTNVNVLKLEKKKLQLLTWQFSIGEKKLQLLTWQFSIGAILLLHETTNTAFIITLVTITTYHLLLEKKVKYFVFLNLLILHSSL